MLRGASSPYEWRRSRYLLKCKPVDDAEAVVVGYLPGTGKYEGLTGALVCKCNNRVVTIGTGLTDEDRMNPPEVGGRVTFTNRHGVPHASRHTRAYARKECNMKTVMQNWFVAEEAASKARAFADRTLARAEKLKAPKRLRPATAKDIKAKAIIWYPGNKQEYSDRDCWKRVEKVLYPSDDWKAYEAHDGCRYGLRGAYVEINQR